MEAEIQKINLPVGVDYDWTLTDNSTGKESSGNFVPTYYDNGSAEAIVERPGGTDYGYNLVNFGEMTFDASQDSGNDYNSPLSWTLVDGSGTTMASPSNYSANGSFSSWDVTQDHCN